MSDPGKGPYQYASPGGCFLRVIWGMAGPAMVLVSAMMIIANKSPYGSWPDFVILGGTLASIAARFFDPGVVDPGRPDGDIGAMSPRRYSIWILGGAVIALVVAHALARLLS